MGGSGGGFFSNGYAPEDLARKTREAEEQSHDAAFETAVGAYLATELAQYNDRDIQGVQQVFESVKHDLEAELEGTVDLLFGGSIAKHTYVDGLSDVDALVLMDRTELSGEAPRGLQEVLAETLRSRFGNASVTVGGLAVTLVHGGQTIQLLPALRDGDKFKIAKYGENAWSLIHPRAFAEKLTAANTAASGKLVPCIKLAKAIIASLPEARRLSGYHAESLAIKVFGSYTGPWTPKAMLRHFFESGAKHVKEPIRDSTGQSVHVDDYLGEANSVPRRIVSDAMARIARRMRNADGAKSEAGWKELFP